MTTVLVHDHPLPGNTDRVAAPRHASRCLATAR